MYPSIFEETACIVVEGKALKERFFDDLRKSSHDCSEKSNFQFCRLYRNNLPEGVFVFFRAIFTNSEHFYFDCEMHENENLIYFKE